MPKPFQYCPMCGSDMALKTDVDGRERQACTACTFVHYENPTPVVAAIVERGEEVVLVRSIGWPESWFGLVTGFLERQESPEVAVLREVREELGVDAALVSFIGHYTFARMNQLIIAYHVTVDASTPITLDTNELEDYKLVPTTKLKPWPFGTGKAVKDWLEERSTQ